MRRLWSYIILACTSLILMGATFTNVFKQSTSNIEYSDGREMVFRISEKDENDLEPENEKGQTPAEVISKSFIERLDSMKITNYQVSTESYDTVKVIVKQETNSNYVNIRNLMTFNGALALSSKLDDFLVNNDETETFLTDKAYLETKENIPTINIPVGDHFKDLLEIVKGYKENNNTSAAESQTEGEGEEATTTYTYKLYLWHDYEDGDTFAQTETGNEEYDSRVAEKRFMDFDIDGIEDDAEQLTAAVNIIDSNTNEKYEAREVRAAFDTARYYVSLINSGELDYKVTFMYEENVPAMTELLVSIDGYVQWSATLRAFICCIVIMGLLLAVFYRLGALSVVTLTLGSVYAGIASLILFTAEFNAAGLIALCAVAIASLVSGVIYCTKLKEEAYRGRSLKKANSEAAKKALLPVVDINVVLIIIGIFVYVFGSTLMRSFAIITVIGGLASLILNTLGLRGFMWLATNTTKLQGKYDVFGIDSKLVPNILKEEKQTYFGSYADKDFTKKKKPIGAIAALLFTAGLAGMITFGVINKGVVYNNGGTTQNTEIFIETDTKNTLITEDSVHAVLENIYTYDKDENKSTALSKQVSDVVYKTREDIGEDDDDKITYTYFVVKLNNKITNDKNAYYVTYDAEGKEASRTYAKDDENKLSGLIESALNYDENGYVIDEDITVDLKVVKLASTAQPEFSPVIWGTLVGIAVSAFYLLLRYRLSRGLSSFIVTTVVTGSVAGFFAYTRLAVTSYAVVVVPLIAAVALFLSIILMNKEREMVLEDKAKDNSIEHRNEIMIRATSLAYSPILLGSILALYIAINFFGFGAAGNAWLFLILAVGIFVSVFFVTTLLGPVAQFFYKLFSKVNMDKFTSKFKRKKKKKNVGVNRSAEPEERTFIGIND